MELEPGVPRRLIVGITGATGIAYGVGILRALREARVESHLIVSAAGDMTRSHESPLSPQELRSLADVVYVPRDVGAAVASGSFLTMGMIIAPCSIRTLSEIATGVTGSLMTRAADVCLKERRRLVLAVRETPLHLGHLRSMTAVTEAGAIVMPPVPAFYTKPETIDDIVTDSVNRMLDLFGIRVAGGKRWGDEGLRLGAG